MNFDYEISRADCIWRNGPEENIRKYTDKKFIIWTLCVRACMCVCGGGGGGGGEGGLDSIRYDNLITQNLIKTP